MRKTMLNLVTKIGLALAVVALSGCNLPRGAPLKTEIIGNSDTASKELDIAVESVTRSTVKSYNSWPATGWHGKYHWFEAKRGPDSSIINAGDNLNLTIWENSDNSLLTGREDRNVKVTKMKVSSTGAVFVPYADYVQVAGLNASQARELIQKRISQVAPDAQVQLELVGGVNNSAYLVSGVARPGAYPLPNRNFSILALISTGGGITPTIENPHVRVIRDGRTYGIPAKILFSDARKNIILRGGDQVIVEEDERFFTAIGSSQREELVYFDREKITVLEALSMMGGLNDLRANPQGVLVLREYKDSDVSNDGKGPSNNFVVFTVDLTSADGLFGARNFRINPGDTVLATESSVKPAEAVIALLGSAIALKNIIN